LLLAQLLTPETRVQVVGVGSKETTWAPARDSGIPIASFAVPKDPRKYVRAIPWLREQVRDDLVIVSKPVFQSFGLALASRVGRRGLVLDIDDWESGLIQRGRHREGLEGFSQWVDRAMSFAERGGVNRFAAARVLEAYARRVPHRIVSNHWLEARFGGRLLYHVRDPSVLDPSRPVEVALGLPRPTVWVGFVGTPRGHKGIGVLVDAVAMARRHADVGLVVMGVSDLDDPLVVRARSLLGEDRFKALPQFPMSELRDHLRELDIVAVPSLDVPAAWGQIPAKLFDAMSMKKPVVASALNDIPEILDGAGIVVEPGSATPLADAIVVLARDADLRGRLGARGREKLVEKYSYAAGRPVLIDVVRSAMR
jgi:glycosyltransferase involved in cell wall biosynthesis